MKNVQVTLDARNKVTGKEINKSIKQVANTKEPVGFVGTLKNGLKFIVEQGKVILL